MTTATVCPHCGKSRTDAVERVERFDRETSLAEIDRLRPGTVARLALRRMPDAFVEAYLDETRRLDGKPAPNRSPARTPSEEHAERMRGLGNQPLPSTVRRKAGADE